MFTITRLAIKAARAERNAVKQFTKLSLKENKTMDAIKQEIGTMAKDVFQNENRKVSGYSKNIFIRGYQWVKSFVKNYKEFSKEIKTILENKKAKLGERKDKFTQLFSKEGKERITQKFAKNVKAKIESAKTNIKTKLEEIKARIDAQPAPKADEAAPKKAPRTGKGKKAGAKSTPKTETKTAAEGTKAGEKAATETKATEEAAA